MDGQQNFLLDKQPRERNATGMMDNTALREKHTFSTKTKALCGCDVELKQSLDD